MRPRPQAAGVSCRLEQLPVLAVDCQSTGAPGRGHLLEVAWAGLPAGGPEPVVESRFVALPAGASLPRRIRSLTGIAPADLAGAPAPHAVWRRLAAAAGARPLVAHFARFERGYLEALRAEHGGESAALRFLCTHEIVCRLMPGLPRRGLRAVAGRLGHVLQGGRRAPAHVRATVAIWRALTRRLAAEADVRTLAELEAWLEATPARRRTGRDFALARATRLDLPDAPGVYRLRARGGTVLYVGKAASLRRRVNSYFQKRRHDAERTPELLAQVADVDVEVTASALEAALLESDEIKRWAPPYNRALLPRAAERPEARAFAALQALLRAPAAADARWRAALGVREDTPLVRACLDAGLAMFRARHDLDDPGCALAPAQVRRLGAQLWRRAQARRDERRATRKAAGSARRTKPAPRAPAVRRPEQVARRLDVTLLRFAHEQRRVAWFERLQSSAVRWRPRARAQGGPARLLIFERGRLARAVDPAPAGPLPARSGGRARRPAGALDAATYDRLRVLTTEVRRLVAAGASLDLALSPRRTLDRAGLARRLRWL